VQDVATITIRPIQAPCPIHRIVFPGMATSESRLVAPGRAYARDRPGYVPPGTRSMSAFGQRGGQRAAGVDTSAGSRTANVEPCP
jgi:hypothetical protein